MKPVQFRSIFLTIFLLFISSIALSVLAYPEIFITFKISFLLWSDYCVEYILNFVLVRSFYQGGLQLWDYFGQMPLTYSYATYGVLHFQNVLTAVLYCILAPFSDHSAELYHHVFAWGNLSAHLLLRLVGIFLVLHCVTKNRWIIGLGAVLFSVFFSQPAFMWGMFYLSFSPLFMYFILRFAQTFRLRFLIATVIFFAITISHGVIYAGYLYLGIHFFIIPCILWALFFNREGWQSFLRRLKTIPRSTLMLSTGAIFLTVILILGPYAYIIKFCLKDVAFGAEYSRISQMFSPDFYFHKLELHLGDPRYFLRDTLDFFSTDFQFWGWTLWFLALCGVVLSRNSIKWIFLGAVVFLWLINHPRESLNIGAIAHWINFLTNPLKTLPRAYYIETYSMLPYLLMPLAALGIESIVELCRGEKYSKKHWGILTLAMLLLAGGTLPHLPQAPAVYLTVYVLALCAAVAWVSAKSSERSRLFLICLLISGTLTDIALSVDKSKAHIAYHYEIKPAALEAIPQAGPIMTEFENPRIFPFRQFHITEFAFPDEVYLWFPRGLGSNFSNVTNQSLNFLFSNGHSPRHAVFQNWPNDPEMGLYVNQNKRTLFLAQYAVKPADGKLKKICTTGLSRDVVMIDDPSGTLQLPDAWPENTSPSEEPKLRSLTMTGPLDNVTLKSNYHFQDDLALFYLYLPENFPKHLASSMFTDEQKYLRFLVQESENKWVELSQVQGKLVKPYTFDVQNIKEGVLIASFPKNNFPMKHTFAFLYPSDDQDGFLKLWHAENDRIGMDYRATRDGWLVLQYPYDTKWKISLDGKKIAYYRANKSFIGFPIAKGDHKILVEYWPDSPLRIWLLFSVIIATLGMFLLMILGLHWEQKNYQPQPKGKSS